MLRKAGTSRYAILLDHQPIVRPETLGVMDMQLSGHTHGGQIFPFKPFMLFS